MHNSYCRCIRCGRLSLIGWPFCISHSSKLIPCFLTATPVPTCSLTSHAATSLSCHSVPAAFDDLLPARPPLPVCHSGGGGGGRRRRLSTQVSSQGQHHMHTLGYSCGASNMSLCEVASCTAFPTSVSLQDMIDICMSYVLYVAHSVTSIDPFILHKYRYRSLAVLVSWLASSMC